MTLIFCDSFDHYASADLGLKWTSKGSDPTIVGSGRFGNRLQSTSPFDSLALTVPAQATYVVGFAYMASQTNSTNVPRMLRLYGGGAEHLRFYLGNTNIIVQRGDNTQLGTGTKAFSTGVWYYVEFKVTINDSTGSVVVRVDGVTDINLTSQDTRNGGNANIDSVVLCGGNNTGGANTHYWDDVYICDTNGSSPTNDFLGDVRVQAIFPDGNGNSSQLVGSDGNSTDNYLLVDETTTPSDADYVESSTVGEKDTYTYGAVTPTAGTVYGLQIVTRAAKTDAGTRSVASIARLSGTEVDSANKALSTTYLYYPDIRETKPGGGAWTISDVNSAEFGVKVTA